MSLALVLVLVAVFGLLVPVLAQLGSASGVATSVARDRRLDELAAENAVQAAIAAARRDPTVGRESIEPCSELPERVNNARAVRVTCQVFSGSGTVRQGPNAPAYALLATGDEETGIVLDGGGTVRTGGPVWSNSPDPAIALRGGVRLDARRDLVGGAGPCPGVTAAPQLCGTVAVPDPAGSESGWGSAVTDFAELTARAVPADPCPAVPASRVYALSPGYYRDLPGLNRLARGECGDVVLWFRPGAFYLDFDFFDPARTTWQLTNALAVGGVPSGWDPAAATSQVAAARAALAGDGSCSRTEDGVELVFGGASRVDLAVPGALELCPVHHRADNEVGQALALTGRTTGTPRQDRASADPATATPAHTGGTFTWPAALPSPSPLGAADCPADGCAVTGELQGRGARGVVTMTIPYDVRAGVRIDDFQVRVVHRAGGDAASVDLALGDLPPGLTCGAFEVVGTDGGWAEATATCAHVPAPASASAGPAITVALTVTNADLDGAVSRIEVDDVEMTVDFTAPDLRAQSGCVVEPGGCPFLDVQGGAEIAVHGTVHAPLARVSADFGGRSAFRFTRGAVLRRFTGLNAPADPGFTPFALPGSPLGPYADRFVVFQAFVDGEAEPTLTARVYFCESLEPDGGWDTRCRARPPQPPRVTAWTVSR
jgi:hypothetical protein